MVLTNSSRLRSTAGECGRVRPLLKRSEMLSGVVSTTTVNTTTYYERFSDSESILPQKYHILDNEWIEHPEGSDEWYWRDPVSSQWVKQ